MNFSDIRDQIVERLSGVWTEIQESQAYGQLKERYDSLPRAAQKSMLTAAAAIFALLLLMFPWSYISSSNESVDAFESRKAMIKELFRVNRQADSLRGMPQPISAPELQGRVQSKLPALGIAGEQIGNVGIFDNAIGKPSSSIPKGVLQQGVSVALKNLNLRQIVDVGYELNALDPSTKMTGVEIAATAANAHYFDVVYKLVSFAMPVEVEPPPAPAKKKAAKKKVETED